MADFSPTQGRYLAFINAYTLTNGIPPAESDIAAAMGVSPPSVNQMIKMLEKKGLIEREPGQSRTVRVLVPREEIPDWNKKAAKLKPARSMSELPKRAAPRKAGAKKSRAHSKHVYALRVGLMDGPRRVKNARKEITRVIEIRGDQTLEVLHEIIFDAFDRDEEHLYEFQLGKGPFDPKGARYGPSEFAEWEDDCGNAETTTVDDLELKKGRTFGYVFDFGDNWVHGIKVESIGPVNPKVEYPRVTNCVGKSPRQYPEW